MGSTLILLILKVGGCCQRIITFAISGARLAARYMLHLGAIWVTWERICLKAACYQVSKKNPRYYTGENPRWRTRTLRETYRLAVLAERLKAFSVGAPLLPGLRILSPLPALILARF